jgi:hypothetical protein
MVYICEACLRTHRKPYCPKCGTKSKNYPMDPVFLSEVLGIDTEAILI